MKPIGVTASGLGATVPTAPTATAGTETGDIPRVPGPASSGTTVIGGEKRRLNTMYGRSPAARRRGLPALDARRRFARTRARLSLWDSWSAAQIALRSEEGRVGKE